MQKCPSCGQPMKAGIKHECPQNDDDGDGIADTVVGAVGDVVGAVADGVGSVIGGLFSDD